MWLTLGVMGDYTDGVLPKSYRVLQERADDMDSDVALLTTNNIPEINVDELERLVEGGGGDSKLALFCQTLPWESGQEIGDDGGTRLPVDGRDPETPPDSNQPPTPPDVIGISPTTSEMPRTVVEQAVGLLLAQQSLGRNDGTIAYAYPFVQEVEIHSAVADSSQLISEDGCGDLPVAGDLISEDGEEADRLAANTAIQQERTEMTGSGNEYYTVTAGSIDEIQDPVTSEGFSISHDDGSLVEQSGRHSDQTVCDDDIEMLAVEEKECHCECGLQLWEEKGKIGYHKFVVNRRFISDSDRSFDSWPEEEDSGMDSSEVDDEPRHSDNFNSEGPVKVGYQDTGAFSEDFHDQEAEGWEDDELMNQEGEMPMQEEETETDQPVSFSKEEPFPGLEEEPADELVEDAELFLGSSEPEVAPSFPPDQLDLEDLVEDLVEETVEGETEAVTEVLVDQGPADAVPTVPAAAPPQVTHVAETSSGSLLDTIIHDEAADKEQLATGEGTVEAENVQDEPAVPFSAPSQSQPAETATDVSSSNVSMVEDSESPPDMARCDDQQIGQSLLSDQELQVASVGSAEFTVATEPLKEQDGNVDKSLEEGMEEPAKKVQSVCKRKRGRSTSHKAPTSKKPKRLRSPSPEIPLPKPRAAMVAQPAALEATLSLAVALSETTVEPAENAVTTSKGAKGQRQKKMAAETTAKPKLKKVVIGPITKEDVDAFVIHNKADVCSHHSLLGHPESVMDKKGNLTFDFRSILERMPAYHLHEILSKMPKSATEIDEQGNLRLKVDAMTNKDSKFKDHLKGYQSRLRAGEYDTDVRRVYYEHAISNLDPWKVKNFEPMYGMIMDRSYKTGSLETLQQELAAKVAAEQEEVQVREDGSIDGS